MKIDAEIRKSKSGTLFIYIPIVEKFVFLEKAELKLLEYELKAMNKSVENK